MTCTVTLAVPGYGLKTNIAVVSGNPELEPEGEVSDDDDAKVNIPEPVITPTPRLTPPPTSAVDADQGTETGSGMLLLLVALGGVMLAAGYLVPATAKSRRDRRS